MSDSFETVTPDGRYIIVRGRLWRTANPNLTAEAKATLVSALMKARRDVKSAKSASDSERLTRARADVQSAKVALGERGPVWWTDGSKDYNRYLVKNTPYAEWYRRLPSSPEFLNLHDDRVVLIQDSYLRLTGKHLVPDSGDIIEKLWSLPQVILAHGTEKDPLFFYGNRAALKLFELTQKELIGMPSRLSAEPLLREERAGLLERVGKHGYIDDYSGVRVSSTGRRFRIRNATVWNLLTAEGDLRGQAATFSAWEFLEG